MSDDPLPSCMERIAAGDPNGMAKLIALVQPDLTRLIASIVPQDDADDIFQTTMMRVWDKAKTYRAGAKVMPWLISIARRAAFDLLRTRRRRTALFEKNTDSEPSLVASLIDDRREIRHHLDELPDLQRQIIHLSFFKKLPLRDIAQQFGISIIQARTIRRKALNSLKEKLKLENL